MSNLGIIHHNDLASIRNCISTTNFKLLESLIDDVAWNLTLQTIDEKINFINTESGYAFDIDVSDNLAIHQLLDLSTTKLVKVLSSTECKHCSVASELLDCNNISAKFDQKLTNDQILIFTHGRCGTNLLKHSLSPDLNVAPNYLHNTIIDNFKNTVDAISQHKEVVTVVRKNFFDYLTSNIIAQRYGAIITNKHNIAEVNEQVKQFVPFEITSSDVSHTFEQFYNFCDMLVYVRQLGVKIHYIFYEDLVALSNTSEVLKNPYKKKNLIINFDYLPKKFYNYNKYYAQTLNKAFSKINYLPQSYLK